jgi:hypothetical protein
MSAQQERVSCFEHLQGLMLNFNNIENLHEISSRVSGQFLVEFQDRSSKNEKRKQGR